MHNDAKRRDGGERLNQFIHSMVLYTGSVAGWVMSEAWCDRGDASLGPRHWCRIAVRDDDVKHDLGLGSIIILFLLFTLSMYAYNF